MEPGRSRSIMPLPVFVSVEASVTAAAAARARAERQRGALTGESETTIERVMVRLVQPICCRATGRWLREGPGDVARAG